MGQERMLDLAGVRRLLARIRTWVIAEVAKIMTISMQVVDALPATGVAMVIYLVPITGQANQYTQHLWVDNAWRNIGTTTIDLTGYWNNTTHTIATNAQIDEVFDEVFGD